MNWRHFRAGGYAVGAIYTACYLAKALWSQDASWAALNFFFLAWNIGFVVWEVRR